MTGSNNDNSTSNGDYPSDRANEAPWLTLAHCLAQAAWWIQRAAEIGAAELETAGVETEVSEYWRGRAEEAERQLRAEKKMNDGEIV